MQVIQDIGQFGNGGERIKLAEHDLLILLGYDELLHAAPVGEIERPG